MGSAGADHGHDRRTYLRKVRGHGEPIQPTLAVANDPPIEEGNVCQECSLNAREQCCSPSMK
jgi:hypothetical protein